MPIAASPTVADLLAQAAGPLFSFEFFPPADDQAAERLWLALKLLQPLEPDFVSVTYGASGSTRQRTIDLTERLARSTSLRTMGHLTCASQPISEIESTIEQYAAAGLNHILAVRGDMPGGPTTPWRPHPQGLPNATELVRLIRRQGDFCVGVAAFPDPHPSRRDPDLDARLLVDKWRAGASFAITQLFFQAESYFALVERVRRLGCDIPIIPGLMPITQISQITRFAELSGAPIPERVAQPLRAVQDDPASLREVGAEIASQLAQDLLDGGAPGLHFFTQNRSVATRAIWAGLRQGPASRRPGSSR
ncbi:MAG: methylenetetrahydrofolate reductase [Propionibacteriaceae bacterium]|jgi:methylenetetrahydrofolate reductase (NADPH)|nr:methylenetetrahydrofolate reductase [Propionibacteriaceae bacterium]